MSERPDVTDVNKLFPLNLKAITGNIVTQGSITAADNNELATCSTLSSSEVATVVLENNGTSDMREARR